jgi:hypothetical protein
MPAEKGNKRALKHGGEAAVKAVQKGEPLTGLARQAELAVYDELHEDGRYALVVRNAARLQAAADLYWDAVSKAAQDRDLDALDRYVKRYGWLAGATLRAWAQVKQEDAARPPALDYDELVAQLRKDKETDEQPDN